MTIRLAQDHAQGNQKPWLVDATPTTQKPGGARNFDDAALAVGQTFYDSVSDIRITVNALSASGAEVLVDVNKSTDPPGNGIGLAGSYFDNADLTVLKMTRTDRTVNFDWTGGSPDPSVSPTTFSVRWQGFLVPQSTGVHAFYTTTDDGVRLGIGNTRIITNWVAGGLRENSGQISLNKGQRYLVRMEYFQDQGGAAAKLEWATPSSGRAVIPTSQLLPF
ncbi:PA14 domain-containing protein [Pendulispora albinea]|uniref:PA14 domain-containing protein n=1 Tax=Pendulispora albinea TaxID=2741071 RepID=A0ABZ2LZ99_9BACT